MSRLNLRCDDRAHAALQMFLEENHVEWKAKVVSKLKPVHNPIHGYAYVCKTKDQKHEKEWRERGIAPTS